MAIQSQPSRIPEPFAGSGTKNTIPATNATPSASQAASWASGFPPECSQPISAGGCPVPRNDVNGALNQLSQDFAFRQDGGIWEWSALADYDAQRVVRGSDGILYWSVQPSGPNVAAGAQDPTADNGTYWTSPSVKTVDVSDSSNAAASTAWVRAWRTSLVLPNDIYVDASTGDDSNPGTAILPFKTITAACDHISSNFVISPQSVNLRIIAGDYTTESINGVPGIGIVCISEGGTVKLKSVYMQGAREVYLDGSFEFVASGSAHISVTRTSYLQLNNGTNIKFSGTLTSYQNIISASFLGAIGVQSGASISLNIATKPGSSAAVVSSNNMGLVSFLGATITWSGSPTGKRYISTANSALIGVGGANVIPGTVAGTVDSTSFFS